MKFTRKDVLEKLKQILTEGGKTLHVSEKTLGDLTDNLMEAEKENEEMTVDAFIAKYKSIFVSVEGNVNHDVSSGVNEFKTKWKEEHPDDGGAGGGKGGPKEGEDTQSPEMKAVLDRLKALEDTNKALAAEKAVSEKRTSLLSKLKEKGIEDEDWVNGMLEQISITEDMDIDSKAEQLLVFYNKTKSAPSPSFTPRTPGGGEPQPNNAIALAAARAKKAREEAEGIS